MKKIWILSLYAGILLVAIACRQKQGDKKNHYTVYQAGQAGPGISPPVQKVIYTCPMHHQVKSDKPGKCPICGMTLELITISKKNMKITLSAREIMLANIKTDTARMRPLANQIILTGTIIFDPRRQDIISAPASGQIRKLYVCNPGEYINTGQSLYDLYSPALLSAEKDYLLAVKQQKLFEAASAGSPAGQGSFTAIIKAMKQKLLRYGLSISQIRSLLQENHADGFVTIYSKTSGYLVEKMKEEGDYVNEGDAVFQTASNNMLWVQAELYDTEIPLLTQHPKLWVETDALPGKKLQADIVYDNPLMNHNARIQLVNISIGNPGSLLQPGMLAYVYLQTGKEKPVVVVPKSAIIYDEHDDYIWLQQPDSAFMRRRVQLGTGNRAQVEILNGIHPGDVVVSQGAYLLNSEYTLKHENNSMTRMKM